MAARMIVAPLHNLHIMGLMLFRPATLFHKIYTLPWYQETLHAWYNSMKCDTGSAILEVGCATGQLTVYMAGHGMNALGVDNSERMLKQANISNTNNAHFKLASALNLPFKNEQFDYVIAASLLNIISKPEVALNEMLRVCKPGGKISVLVPQAGMTDEAINKLANELNLSGFSRTALTTWHRRAPKMQLKQLLEHFNHAGLQHCSTGIYLNGMVATVTGTQLLTCA